MAVSDKMTVSQKVATATPVRTIQATLLQLDQPQTMKVQAPADALPGRGGILAHFNARLGDDLPGVREYMSRYPYTCFEQNTCARSPCATRKCGRRTWRASASTWTVTACCATSLTPGQGSDVLTAYVLAVGDEAT
ncbi:hypothetical protein LP420_07140 [Massilia sp. B-10]|nr:hypothetical protein LP420_07140 [Massilia sp. B-10]